ncbi:MAG: hypothetical protein ACOY90_05300 [Candidatus Zhuqueibacterota bacterium]
MLLYLTGLTLSLATESTAQSTSYSDCWKSQQYTTLLDTMRSVMKTSIEPEYQQHDFIQTFGCAYEEDDIQQNSTRAVYRAIIQSIRNRKLSLRDDLERVLLSKPPRPDNLAREYSIYVNIPAEPEPKAARYEIKILNLEAVPTVESEKAVWTRIVTRYAYKEDFNIAPAADITASEFVNVMEMSQELLQLSEKKKFNRLKKLFSFDNVALAYPKTITELVFGDSFYLFDETKPEVQYQGVFLGKGLFICETQSDQIIVSKFGEERLYSLRVDINSFRRTNNIFAELNYEAPESILQCLYLKYSQDKPRQLPALMGFK